MLVVPHVDVEDIKTGEPYTLLCMSGQKERDMVRSGSSKVLSVDFVLKGAAAILLTILTGISSWLLVTVIDHSSRITKNEVTIEVQEKDDLKMIELLRHISETQSTLLQNQAKFGVEICNIKEKLHGK